MVPRETQPLKLQRAERNNALSLKGRFACYPPLVALREAHFEVCWQTGLVTRELWGGGSPPQGLPQSILGRRAASHRMTRCGSRMAVHGQKETWTSALESWIRSPPPSAGRRNVQTAVPEPGAA